MSIGVSGIIFAENRDVDYEMELSFNFVEIANEYRIGSKLGGNVSSKTYSNYQEMTNQYAFLFELTDCPLDLYADELFKPTMYFEDGSIANPLIERMAIVEELLIKIMNCQHVTKIILDINYLFGFKENTITIKASDFAKTMCNIYKDDIDPPVIRFIIE